MRLKGKEFIDMKYSFQLRDKNKKMEQDAPEYVTTEACKAAAAQYCIDNEKEVLLFWTVGNIRYAFGQVRIRDGKVRYSDIKTRMLT